MSEKVSGTMKNGVLELKLPKRAPKLSEVLSEVDLRMEGLESERADLLDVRNWAMREASGIAGNFASSDMRRMLFHILNEHDGEVGHSWSARFWRSPKGITSGSGHSYP